MMMNGSMTIMENNFSLIWNPYTGRQLQPLNRRQRIFIYQNNLDMNPPGCDIGKY